MSTFVTLHGGWGGGWQWRQVAQLLRASGHEVTTPTLSGLGERAHAAPAEITFETHVNDVTEHLWFEDINRRSSSGGAMGRWWRRPSPTESLNVSAWSSTWTASLREKGSRALTGWTTSLLLRVTQTCWNLPVHQTLREPFTTSRSGVSSQTD
jgi:hypothetical protein